MSDTAAPARRNPFAGLSIGGVLLEARAFLALVVIFVIFSILAPTAFPTISNVIIMCQQVSVYALLSIGMLVVILNGGIDLSVGSTLGLSGMVAGSGPAGLQDRRLHAVSVGLGGGGPGRRRRSAGRPDQRPAGGQAQCGAVRGHPGHALRRSRPRPADHQRPDREQPGRRAKRWATPASTGSASTRSSASRSASGSWSSWPILGSLLLNRSVYGRWLYASGGNERAAELSGVPVKSVKIRAYVISGVCAAIAGVILTSELTSAGPTQGTSYELTAIAAVVIGGAALTGGRGNIRGTLLGPS